MSKIEPYITSIPDFPEPGVIFRDITTAIGSADGLQLSVDEMAALLEGEPFDVVAGLESRGFLFGMPIAYKLHKPFIPIRKEGKLPRETVGATYSLEYGTATIEVHKDDIKPGMWVRFREEKWDISTLGEYSFKRTYLGLKASLSKGVSG